MSGTTSRGSSLVSKGLSLLSRLFSRLFTVDPKERVKFALTTMAFFFVIASYTLVKELKDSIFITVIGKDFLLWAKLASIGCMVPAVMFYSYLVDRMRRYQLLMFYSLLYGCLGLIFAYFVGHPTIGITNTNASPWRLFGWVFYFFIEGYSPFIVGVFWAFANSITNPREAKKNYGLMVAGSKFGGLASAAFAWYLFSCSLLPGIGSFTGVMKHQILVAGAAILILFVPLALLVLIRYVPGYSLHGYEVAYQVEKEKVNTEKKQKNGVGMLEGLWLMIKNPYVFGIFGMIAFYEICFVVLNYQRIIMIEETSENISGLSCTLFKHIFYVHCIGFLFSLIGTRTLMEKLGERRCLLLIPLISGIFIAYFILTNTYYSVVAVFMGLRALNYAFSYPVRESLYIPTVKDIKFKSKSWIDAFGTKSAKGFGCIFSIISRQVLYFAGASVFVVVNSLFLVLIVMLWGGAAYLLGRRYDRAIRNNEVIGAESLEDEVRV